jgi:phospholipase A1/A2
MKQASSLCLATLCLLIFGASLPGVSQAGALSDMEQCMLQAMKTAGDDMTMGQARAMCKKQAKDATAGQTAQQKPQERVLDRRLAVDQSNILKPFTLMAHKPNYFLFAAYNTSGYNPTVYREQFSDEAIEFQQTEVQFQISLKVPLAVKLFHDKASLWGAYTNRSFWQVYDKLDSSPFRETNHEPEIWLQFDAAWKFWGIENRANSMGLVHQSNGRGGVLSRSWNRVFANFVFERGQFAFSVKPWVRIPEDRADDDNPNITDYLGHGEITAAYKWGENTFSLMFRNQLESGFQRGAVQFGWSFPLWNYKYVKGYFQYFNGYGLSLIDYDEYANVFGIGISLTDWL